MPTKPVKPLTPKTSAVKVAPSRGAPSPAPSYDASEEEVYNPAGSLDASLSTLGDDLSALHTALTMLSDRMTSVCVPSPELAMASTPVRDSAPLTITLTNYSEQIRSARHRVEALLDTMIL